MSNPWFRLYAEFSSDPVVQSLAFEDQRHFVVIMCLKCSGVLDRQITRPNRERIICRGLGLDPMAAAEVRRRLSDVGLIDQNWQPVAWDKRQFISDNRRQSRGIVRDLPSENDKNSHKPLNNNESENNGSLFPYVSVSDTDQNNDAPPKKKKRRGDPFVLDPRIDPGVWERFEQHRRTLGRPLTDKARELNAEVLIGLTIEQQRESLARTLKNDYRGLFPPPAAHGSAGRTSERPGGPPDTDAMIRKGKAAGILAKPGESTQAYIMRLNRVLQERERQGRPVNQSNQGAR